MLGTAVRAVLQPSRRAVISCGEDSSFTNDDRSDLPPGARRPGLDQVRDLHKVVVPTRALRHRLAIMAELAGTNNCLAARSRAVE